MVDSRMPVIEPAKVNQNAGDGLTRRSFMKWSAAVAGTAAVSAQLLPASQTAFSNAESPAAKTKIFRSANTPECLHCALLVHVEDGKVRKITADPDFHIKACARGISRTNQLYSPHRLKKPMKRKGERGSGEWEEISWDEALDTIAEKMKTIRSESGNEAFLPIGGTGNWSSLSTGINGLWGSFWNRFGGSTTTVGSLCCISVTEGFNAIFGGNRSEFRDEWIHSRYFIAWGNNPAVTNVGYFKNILDARDKNGAKLVVIDPRRSETAAMADDWIQVRPGTDAAVSLGMMNVILKEKLYDEPYLKAYTNAPFLIKLGEKGYDLAGKIASWEPGKDLPIDLKDLSLMTQPAADPAGKPVYFVWDDQQNRPVPADSPGVNPRLEGTFEVDGITYQTVHSWMAAIASRYTPEVVERITAAPGDVVQRIAREYASVKPAAIIQNMAAAQRTDQGTLTVIGQLYLAALTGNVGVLGGGVNDNGGVMQTHKINYPVPLQKNPPIKQIPVTQVARAILEENPYKIRFLHVAGSNLVSQHPETNKMIEAFKKVDFFVVQDIFMTATAKYADIVLPVTTIFETRNLIAGKRERHIQLMEQAIEPLFESKSDQWILTELAKRLGFGEAFDKPTDELIRHVIKDSGVTLEQLEKGPVNPMPSPWIPFGDKKFETTSGRIEFFSTYLQKKGFEPLLDYEEPVEVPWMQPELAKKYPLQLVNRRNHNQVNSSFYHHSHLLEIFPGQVLQISPSDAKARGIKDGQKVQVLNDRGRVEATAQIYPGLMAGVVTLNTGFGGLDEREAASQLSPDKYDKRSYGHTLNSSMVDVVIA